MIDRLEASRNDWLLGKIDDAELSDAFRRVNFSTIRRLGLVEAFDEISQIICVAEWMAGSNIAGDSTESIRRYAEKTWRTKIADSRNCDPSPL